MLPKMKNSKVIFIGDKAQLDPVNNRDENGNDVPSKALDFEDQYELTEVMRNASDSPLLSVATGLRNSQKQSLLTKNGGKHSDAALSSYARKTAHSHAGGVVFVGEPARRKCEFNSLLINSLRALNMPKIAIMLNL